MRKPLIAGISLGLGLWLTPMAHAGPPNPCPPGYWPDTSPNGWGTPYWCEPDQPQPIQGPLKSPIEGPPPQPAVPNNVPDSPNNPAKRPLPTRPTNPNQ
jgi:hypothetical protein